MRWKDGYKPNPERKWEPVADGKHIWCFCKVDVGTFDYDEKNKDGTTKDPSKMKQKDLDVLLKNAHATKNTKQQINSTMVKKSWYEYRTVHGGCEEYNGSPGAIKKGSYEC